MGSLYTNELRTQVSNSTWPLGLRYRVAEYDDPAQLRFVLYRENINSLSSDDKLLLASTLGALLRRVNDGGIPMFTRVKAGDGRHDCELDHHFECEDGCAYA